MGLLALFLVHGHELPVTLKETIKKKYFQLIWQNFVKVPKIVCLKKRSEANIAY